MLGEPRCGFKVSERSVNVLLGKAGAQNDVPKGSLAKLSFQFIVGDPRAAGEAALGPQMIESVGARRGAARRAALDLFHFYATSRFPPLKDELGNDGRTCASFGSNAKSRGRRGD